MWQHLNLATLSEGLYLCLLSSFQLSCRVGKKCVKDFFLGGGMHMKLYFVAPV